MNFNLNVKASMKILKRGNLETFLIKQIFNLKLNFYFN